MNKKIYTVEENGIVKINQLRKNLDGCARQKLPPLNPSAKEHFLEPPPLSGLLFWGKTLDDKIYGLFCTQTEESEEGKKAVETVLGIWVEPEEKDDRAILEFLAKNWKMKSEDVKSGRMVAYDEDVRRRARTKR